MNDANAQGREVNESKPQEASMVRATSGVPVQDVDRLLCATLGHAGLTPRRPVDQNEATGCVS